MGMSEQKMRDALKVAINWIEHDGCQIGWSLDRLKEALSQREAVEPVACKTCNGIGVVDDGEIDCFDDGTPYECGPIKCVKDCPTCTAPPSREVSEEWREKFAEEVYESLAAADNQDIALEEYPARILKVLDSIIGPRHPTVTKWRDDAIKACADIADRYGATYAATDIRALLASKGGAA